MAIKVDLNNYNYAADELKKTPDYYSDAISNIDTVLRNLDYKVLAYVKSDLIDIKNSLNTMSSFALELQEDLVSTKAKYLQAEEKAKNVGNTIISIASTLGGVAIGATTGGAIGAAIGGAAGSAIGTSLGESTKAASSIGAAFEKAGEAIVNTAATVGNYVTSAASKIAGFFSDIGDFLWTGVKKVGASVANTVIGLFQGLDEFVEAIGDTCAIIGAAAASIFTGAYDLGQWIGGKISGNENWNSATKAMWNSTMDYVAVTHAKNAYKDFYENNPIGQWLDANAFGWFKSTGAAYQVASGLGYVAGVILLTIATFGIGGAAVGGGAAATGAATTAAATTTATLSVTAGQTALIAGTAGFGRGAETAWSQGATLGEGLTYATLNAGWEGLQFYVGSKIGAPGGYGDQVANRILGQSVSTGTRALVTSGTRVTLDALDGGIEGFVQPLLQVTYADGYYDDSGNFIKFTEKDDLFARASALFDDMGGWSNVAIQTAIGGGGSLIGEAGDLRRFLKSSSGSTPDLTTPDLIDIEPQTIIDDKVVDIDVDEKNILSEVEPTNVIDVLDEDLETTLTSIPIIKEIDEISNQLDLIDAEDIGDNIPELFPDVQDPLTETIENIDEPNIVSVVGGEKELVDLATDLSTKQIDIMNSAKELFKDAKKLTTEELAQLNPANMTHGDRINVAYTYLIQNVGLDLDNIPASVLDINIYNPNIAVNGTKVLDRVCIKDIGGSLSRSYNNLLEYLLGSYNSSNNYLQRTIDGYLKHMDNDLRASTKNLYSNFELGEVVPNGASTAFEFIEKDGKYFLINDGNHRLETLILKYQTEIAAATSQAEIDLINEKYTFNVPVISETASKFDIDTTNTIVDASGFSSTEKNVLLNRVSSQTPNNLNWMKKEFGQYLSTEQLAKLDDLINNSKINIIEDGTNSSNIVFIDPETKIININIASDQIQTTSAIELSNLINKDELYSVVFDYLAKTPELDDLGNLIYKEVKEGLITGAMNNATNMVVFQPGGLDSLFSGNFDQFLKTSQMKSLYNNTNKELLDIISKYPNLFGTNGTISISNLQYSEILSNMLTNYELIKNTDMLERMKSTNPSLFERNLYNNITWNIINKFSTLGEFDVNKSNPEILSDFINRMRKNSGNLNFNEILNSKEFIEIQSLLTILGDDTSLKQIDSIVNGNNVQIDRLIQLEQEAIDKVSKLKELFETDISQMDEWEQDNLSYTIFELRQKIINSGLTGGQLASIIPLADQSKINMFFIDDSMLKIINERLNLSTDNAYITADSLKNGIFDYYDYKNLLDYESRKIFDTVKECRKYLSETDYNDLMNSISSNRSVNLDGKINISSSPTYTGEISSIALNSSFIKNLADSSTYDETIKYLKKYVAGELTMHDAFSIIYTDLSKYCDYSTTNAYTSLLNNITTAYNNGNTIAALHNLEYLAKKINQGDLEFKMVPGEAYASSIVFALDSMVNDSSTAFHEFGHVMHIDSQGYNIPIRGAELLEKAKNNALQNGGPILSYLTSIQKNIDIAAEQASMSFDNWVVDTYGSVQDYKVSLKEYYKNVDIQNIIDEFGIKALGISEETAKKLKMNKRTLDSLVNSIYNANRKAYIEVAERQVDGSEIADCIAAVFKDRNVVIDGQQVPIKYAHDAKYWSETLFNSYTEIIANYNSLLLTGNYEAISFLELVFGKEFMNAISEIYNATY